MIFGLKAKPLAAGLGLGIATLLAPPARALVIVPTYDSTIGSMSDAATIEHAFGVAANAFAKRISSPVTVYVDVSWGQLNGGSLPSGALGASSDPLYGSYTFAQVAGMLPGSDVLPANPASGQSNYYVPSAEAKAIGALPANRNSADGYIGFGLTLANYSFGASTTASDTYNFIGVAKHELAEVLGRISGIGSTFATPFDLFRYSKASNGVPQSSFSASDPAYFSHNGGATQDGPRFNNTGSGDVSDWYSTPSGTDAQDAFLYLGITPKLSWADVDALTAIGWSMNATTSQSRTPAGVTTEAALVSEPGSLALLSIATALLIGGTLVPRSRGCAQAS